MLVLPLECTALFRYALTAILAALAMWGLEQRPAGQVRPSLSPVPRSGFSDAHLWSSVRRWVKRRDELWPMVHVAARATLRETAAALVVALVARLARAPPVPEVRHAWEAALVR